MTLQNKVVSSTGAQSPIQQMVIDGEMYWDQIAANWMRLIHRSSFDVIGSYRKDQVNVNAIWIAKIGTREGTFYTTDAFDTEDAARTWVEEYAARNY